MTITCLPVRKGSLMITVASMLSVPLIVIKTILDIYWGENDGGSISQI